MISIVVWTPGDVVAAAVAALVLLTILVMAIVDSCQAAWRRCRRWWKAGPGLTHRFPLPVSHTRFPRVVPITTALLAGAALFAAGFCTAVYTIGLIVTAP